MFDFSRVKNKEIVDKVRQEAKTFMGRCHFGCQGIEKTEQNVIDTMNKALDEGFLPAAFDSEIVYVPLMKSIIGEKVPIHAAVSYPKGCMTLNQKMKDLERLRKIGVTDTCVCLNWQALFSGRYDAIEHEASTIMKEFKDAFVKNAFVIPATLMSDTEILATCAALDAAGVISIKVNPGAKLGVSFEEVALIKRNFPLRFDIHPSGNIRTLAEVERYLELGCETIHTASAVEVTQEYMNRQLRKYGGI